MKIKVILAVLFSAMIMTSVIVPVRADDESINNGGFQSSSGQIESGVKNVCRDLYNLITSIVAPIATVLTAGTAVVALFGGERAMEKAKSYMLRVVGVFALVFGAGTIVMEIQGWFSVMNNPVFSDITRSFLTRL